MCLFNLITALLLLQGFLSSVTSRFKLSNSPSFTSSESSFKVNSSNGSHRDTSTTKPLLRSHGLNEIGSSNSSSCSSTTMATELEELVGFLSSPSPAVTKAAVDIVRGLTGSDDGLQSLGNYSKILLPSLSRLVAGNKEVAEPAAEALVNLSQNSDLALARCWLCF